MTEWRKTCLGAALDVRHGYAFKGENFSDSGELIVLTPGNFFDEGGFKAKSGKEKYYDGPYPGQYLLEPGDVVVAMTEQSLGLLGSSATIPPDGRYLHNQRIGLLRVTDPDQLDLRFAYHLMNFSGVRRQIQATATGAKIRHTAPERIKGVTVMLPDIETQRRIAAILDSVDGLIENTSNRSAVLEKMARAIYREWLVQFRYPRHELDSLVDSPLGAIPEGWTVTNLQSVAAVNRATTKPNLGTTFRYLDISCLGDRSLALPSTLEAAMAPGRARRVVGAGDVVWSMVRPNRRAHALLVEPGADWIASTGLAVVTPSSVPSSLLFETMSAPEFTDYLVSKETVAAYPAVKPSDFESAPFLLPPVEVVEAFDQAVGPLHQLVWSLRDECAGLVTTRSLLLPKLVTGQVDVSALNLADLFESAAA